MAHGHGATARLTDHARQRCREMGVLTKVVKRLVRDPKIRYPSWSGRFVACDGTLAVVYAIDPDSVPAVITVLYDGIEFIRPPHTDD
jgi:hypothetical protein